MLTFPLIQVAGVIDAAEADLLVACGVRYLGFPLRLPVHREDLDETAAARIIRGLAPPCQGVLITYLDDAPAVRDLARALGARIVQLHGDVDAPTLARLRELAPGIAVVKSLVVGKQSNDALLETALRLEPEVDAFITDTFDPASGASGATGTTHDWAVSRRIVERVSRPVILAGGLTPENVARAIAEVGPAGVDVHTGVEGPDGRKSRGKVGAFLAAASEAFARRQEH